MQLLLIVAHFFSRGAVNGFVLHARPQYVSASRVAFTWNTIHRSTTQEVAELVGAPDDAVILVKPKAMTRLLELKAKQPNPKDTLILRMGVRNGGCSGLSYSMDFSTEDAIGEDDAVDEYPEYGVKCVVDAKSMLYLYGLQLDYSDELIGGGFKFFNPNAEESCGCGSSFGV